MASQYITFVVFCCITRAFADIGTQTSQPSDLHHVDYKPQDGVNNYVPHSTYPFADSYGPTPGYEGYLVPAVGSPYAAQPNEYPVTPKSQTALQITLKVLAKVGLFLVGGIALLLVGGAFTAAVCSLSPICTITYHGFGDINKETVRAMVSPDRIATAAAFVGDALDKYNRFQRAVNGN